MVPVFLATSLLEIELPPPGPKRRHVQDPGDSSSSTSTGTPEDFKYLTSFLNFNFIKKNLKTIISYRFCHYFLSFQKYRTSCNSSYFHKGPGLCVRFFLLYLIVQYQLIQLCQNNSKNSTGFFLLTK